MIKLSQGEEMVNLGNDWDNILSDEFQKEYYIKIRQMLKAEYQTHIVYPDMNNIFSALKTTPFSSIKVVLLGQDPYHNAGQAHGMCFSVMPDVDIPPSLSNIFKELHNDIGCKIPDNGCLTEWAKQGVLLLNTVLTVRAGAANSHRNIGWEIFSDTVIKYINSNKNNVVFLLWGNNARSKKILIDSTRHCVLEAAHPSPLSAFNGFLGCRHFSKANEYLKEHNIEQINWQISDQNSQKLSRVI